MSVALKLTIFKILTLVVVALAATPAYLMFESAEDHQATFAAIAMPSSAEPAPAPLLDTLN